MDARRAPEWVGEGHGADELGDLQIDGRTTGSTASRLPAPERAEALPVPANHGLRLNDLERLVPPCPPLREPQPEDAVEETDPRSLGAAAEQGELLSQRQVLKNEVGAGLQRSAQSAQQSEYEGHCYAGSLDRRPTSSVATDILANDRARRSRPTPSSGAWACRRLRLAERSTSRLLSSTRLRRRAPRGRRAQACASAFSAGRAADREEGVLSLYGKIKGRTERELAKLNPNLFCFRPA